MTKTKSFVSCSYQIKHNLYNEKETKKLLENDIRTKLLGNVNLFLKKPKHKIYLKSNKNIEYVGGFYYEIEENENHLVNCKEIVNKEKAELEQSDLVICIINNTSPIGTITELLYAAYLNKEIVIFADPNICQMNKNYRFWYSVLMAKKFDDNITFINSCEEKVILKYLENYKKTNQKEKAKKIKEYENKNKRDINLFLSADYGVQHKYVNKKNVVTLMQNNIRNKLLKNPKNFAFENEGNYINKRNRLKYIGGFYYYFLSGENNNNEFAEHELLTNSMIEKLESADIVVSIFDAYERIGVVSELLYAAFRNKKTIVFYYDNITKFQKEFEYWYPIILAQNINPEIELIKVEKEDEIVKYIKKIKLQKNKSCESGKKI